MPGSGKSTTGKLLAHKLGYEFIDLDAEIEKQEKKSIKQVFEERGESYFRDIENKVLAHIISDWKGDAVVSLGGGTVAFQNNLERVKYAGKLIYLEVKPHLLVERLKHETTNRPLLNTTDPALKINLLLSLRESFYRQSHFTVDANEKPDETVAKIVSVIA